MFNGAFTISENSNLGTIILTDTSIGDDPALTGRTINIFKANGAAFVAAIPWPIADDTIILDNIFPVSQAVNIVVNWVSAAPEAAPSTYTANTVFAYMGYIEYFLYYLTQLQLANPTIIQSDGYYTNKSKVRSEVDSAQNAVDFAADIEAAQACIERAQYMIDNQKLYF